MTPNIVSLTMEMAYKVRGMLCSKTKNEPELHYHRTPIPGIYEHVTGQTRYLRYIKADPNGKESPTGPSFNDIFISKIRREETVIQKSTKNVEEKSFSWDNSCTLNNTIISNQDKDYLTRAQARSTSSSLSWSAIARIKRTNHPKIDLDGYFQLRRPLHVQYHKILERWMFSDEIKHRTLIAEVEMVEPGSLPKHNPDVRIIEREFLLLDDGRSWVFTGRAPADIDFMSRNRQMLEVEPSEYDQTCLFIMDDWEEETMRPQTAAEVKKSLQAIFGNEGITLSHRRKINYSQAFYAEVNEYHLMRQAKKELFKAMHTL